MQVHGTQHAATLLSLPLELRLEIYTYLFGVPAHPVKDHRVLHVHGLVSGTNPCEGGSGVGPMAVEHASSTCYLRFSHPQLNHAALLRTCSQIYLESRFTFWAAVLVQFDPSFLGISAFLDQSSIFARHAVTSITLSRQVYCPTDPRYESADRDWALACTQLAKGLPNLREVKVLLSGKIDRLLLGNVRNSILGPIIDAGWEDVLVLKIRFEGLFAEAEAVEMLVSLGGLARIEGGDVVLWRYISFKGLKSLT